MLIHQPETILVARLRQLLRDFRRRRVGRTAGAYGATALATVLAVAELYDDIGLPEGTPRVVILMLVMGFPVALALAWAYEVRSEEAAPPRSADVGEREAGLRSKPADAESEAPRSVVVLPFDNISPDEGDAYLSDGLTEEITADLAFIRALRVISRSSATALKASKRSVHEMAEHVGVRYVLEGSVRKVGDSLRVTAQLIDATTDDHVWAGKYDGTMEDVFAMQEEVSRSIVRALEVEIRPEESHHLGERPIEDPEAYAHYLRARQETWLFTKEALDRARDYLGRAQDIVGDNALIQAGFGYVYAQYINMGFGHEQMIDQAEAHARRALELDPDSPQAHLVLGLVYQFMRPDIEKSIHHLERSLEGGPDDPHTMAWLVVAYSLAGRGERIRDLAQRALDVDPLTPMNRMLPGFAEWMEGRYDEAAAHALEWYRRDPDNILALFFRTFMLAWAGETREARSVLEKLPPNPEEGFSKLVWLLKHAIDGQGSRMLRMLKDDPDFVKNLRRDPQLAYMAASALALVDERAATMEYLHHALRGGFKNYAWLAQHDPFVTRYLDDADYQAILRQVKQASD